MKPTKGKMAKTERTVRIDYGFKAGWYDVGNQHCYFRSGLEYRWAKYLEWLKGLGEIVSWLYEPRKFEFKKIRSGTVFYTPDFLVLYGAPYEPNHCWHELKGHLKQKDVTKLRRMAKYYPDEKIILIMQNIPKTRTKRNVELFRRLENAEKYIERVMEAEKILKEVGI